MTAVSLSARGGVAFITIDAPPVNALSLAVRAGLAAAFRSAAADARVRGIVLNGAGRGFSAGGDIREMDTPDASAFPQLSADLHPIIEACGKPVVAAIHGFALGGGLETALVCHRRVATIDAQLGFPEGKLGLLPLSGTQRLPRLIGLAPALDMILTGARVEAAGAPIGLINVATTQNDLLDAAAELARGPAPPLARDLPAPHDETGVLIAAWRARINAGALPAIAHRQIDAIVAGLNAADFDTGLATARQLYEQSLHTPESIAARSTFIERNRSQEPRT